MNFVRVSRHIRRALNTEHLYHRHSHKYYLGTTTDFLFVFIRLSILTTCYYKIQSQVDYSPPFLVSNTSIGRAGQCMVKNVLSHAKSQALQSGNNFEGEYLTLNLTI
jgi:hypothetical protein